MRRLLAGIAVGLGGLLGLSSPAWAVTGSQRFTLYGENGPTTIVGSGPISGIGQSNRTGRGKETDVFPGGTIYISHPLTRSSQSFDPVTCVGRATFTGTYSITGGTGAYAGASGQGTYAGQEFFITDRTATGCSEKSLFDFVVVRATGSTTVP